MRSRRSSAGATEPRDPATEAGAGDAGAIDSPVTAVAVAAILFRHQCHCRLASAATVAVAEAALTKD